MVWVVGGNDIWRTVSIINITLIATIFAVHRSVSTVTAMGMSPSVLPSTNPTINGSTSSSEVSCEVARMKCAFRVGCGMALQNYMVGCSDVMSGRIRRCNDLCKKALIALTSTEEGQDLMRCDCQGQDFCHVTKQRIEICRPDVMKANEDDSIVSCSVAQWICAADPLCSTAVEYYRRLCRSMFHGKKCTMRCNNSISILNRQEKAAKLKTCVCDGTEDYDCDAIKFNMDRLCFPKSHLQHHHHHHHNNNEIQGDSPGSSNNGGTKSRHKSPCSNGASSLTLYSRDMTTVHFHLVLLLTLAAQWTAMQLLFGLCSGSSVLGL